MKRFVVTISIAVGAMGAPANAADQPLKAPAAIVAQTWSGCYVGVAAGGAWAKSESISNGLLNGIPTGSEGVLKATHNLRGPMAGGTLGCNYQVNQLVFGVEGDLSWADIKNTSILLPPFNPFIHQMRESYLATVRGRLGHSWNQTLFYVTGGAAWAGVEISSRSPNAPAASAANSGQLQGWTVGGGIEHAFTPNISAKIEYLYAQFSRHNFFETTFTGCCTSEATDLRQHLIRVGVNLRFGGPM